MGKALSWEPRGSGSALRKVAAMVLIVLWLPVVWAGQASLGSLSHLRSVASIVRFLEEDPMTLAPTEVGTESVTEGETEELGILTRPFALGTPIYYEFEDDGWYYGAITDYDEETDLYTVTYEDESLDVFSGSDPVLSTMIQQGADYEPYESGNVVYDSLHENSPWGLIDIFRDNGYEIVWEDGSTTLETSLRDVDDWIHAAAEATLRGEAPGDSEGSLEMGTFVLEKDPLGPDKHGFLVDYETSTECYLVMFESGNTEYYKEDSPELAALLADAKAYQPYPIGTRVEKDTPGGAVLQGTVHAYQNGEYTVFWSDLSQERLPIHTVDGMLSSIQPSQLSGEEGANAYEIGTLAFQLVYEDMGILYGHITGYNSATDTYTVSYEDGTEAKYAGDSADLLVQVTVGQMYEVHPVGTLVFDEDCNPGTVETFEHVTGKYTIQWQDGSSGYYGMGTVADMVELAEGEDETLAPTEAETNGTTEATTEATTEEATPEPTVATLPPVASPTPPPTVGSPLHEEEEEEEEMTMLFGLITVEPGSNLYLATPMQRFLVQGIFLGILGLLAFCSYCCCCRRKRGGKGNANADMGQYRKVAAFSDDGFMDDDDIEMIHREIKHH